MRIVEKYKKGLNKDAADVSLVFFMIAVPVFLLCLSYVVSISNILLEKEGHTNAAQEALKASIRKVDGRGSLGVKSVEEFMRVHKQIMKEDGLIYKECGYVNGNSYNHPKYEIQISQRRDLEENLQPQYVFYGYGAPYIGYPQHDTSKVNRVISVKVTTLLYEPMPWQNGCSPVETYVSAIAFGDKADLRQEKASLAGIEPFEENIVKTVSRNHPIVIKPGDNRVIHPNLILISDNENLTQIIARGQYAKHQSRGKSVTYDDIGKVGYAFQSGTHPEGSRTINWRYCLKDNTKICPGKGRLSITWTGTYDGSSWGAKPVDQWDDGKPVPKDWFKPGTGPGAGLNVSVVKKDVIPTNGHDHIYWYKDTINLKPGQVVRNVEVITPAGVKGILNINNYDYGWYPTATFSIDKSRTKSEIPKIIIYQYYVCDKATNTNCERKRVKVKWE